MTSRTVLITPLETAARLRLSVSSIGRWRVEGVGPAYIKRQGRVFYSEDAIEAYLTSASRAKTRDAMPAYIDRQGEGR